MIYDQKKPIISIEKLEPENVFRFLQFFIKVK